MQAVKVALANSALKDLDLITMLGGFHVYYRLSAIDITSIFNDGAKAIVTFFEVSGGRTDKELPQANELYQFDVWSRSENLNDAIAERLVAILDPDDPPLGWSSISIEGRRLGELNLEPPAQELYEDDMQLHHKALQFRVISYPA